MRISDWSSDVCASDLCQARPLRSRFSRRTRRTKLYGRDSEVQCLVKCWGKVRKERRGQIAVISGEAGIGKSRLLYEMQQVLQPSAHFLVQCSPAFQKSTLHPFLAELKRYAGIADEDKRSEERRVGKEWVSTGKYRVSA